MPVCHQKANRSHIRLCLPLVVLLLYVPEPEPEPDSSTSRGGPERPKDNQCTVTSSTTVRMP